MTSLNIIGKGGEQLGVSDRVSEFLELIEKIDDMNMDTPDTEIRRQLREKVKEQREASLEKKLSEEEEKDQQLREQFELLAKMEEEGNLCWMDYGSWRHYLNKDQFIELISPVLWNGVFFSVENLLLHYERLFLRGNKESAFVFGKGPFYYRVFGFGLIPNKDPVDYLDDEHFKMKKHFFEEFLVLRQTGYQEDNRVFDLVTDSYHELFNTFFSITGEK